MKKKITLASLGADPEVFLLDQSKGFISSEIVGIPGDKNNPVTLAEGFSILKDNVMLEFNIPASFSKEQYIKNMDDAFNIIKQNINPDLSFSTDCSANFPIEQLMTEHAQTFGCEPDFNAWTLGVNNFPNVSDMTLRTAGGHIHVGYEEPDEYRSIITLRLLDLYLGVPSVLLDNDTERRKMYGKAGCYRFKHYGFEYRVLSNFWIFKPELISWVWEGVENAFLIMNSMEDEELEKYIKSFKKDVIKCINTTDKKLAESLIKENNLILV